MTLFEIQNKRRNFRGQQSGFTMVELLVVMVIGALLTLGVIALFINQTRAMAFSEDLVDLEQNLRVAMDMIHRDIRMAGAYSSDQFPAFVIGAIDTNGDGTLDKNYEGGANLDTIQIRYSDDNGMNIEKVSGTQFFVCFPSNVVDDQIIGFSKLDGSGAVELKVKNDGEVSCTECPGTCDRIAIAPPGISGYEDGTLWNNLSVITYFLEPDYVESGISFGPTLMQKRGLGTNHPPAVVAFGINGLDIVYRDVDGDPTTTLTDIHRVSITLSGRTRNEHDIAGVRDYRTRTLTTEIVVRNLVF